MNEPQEWETVADLEIGGGRIQRVQVIDEKNLVRHLILEPDGKVVKTGRAIECVDDAELDRRALDFERMLRLRN